MDLSDHSRLPTHRINMGSKQVAAIRQPVAMECQIMEAAALVCHTMQAEGSAEGRTVQVQAQAAAASAEGGMGRMEADRAVYAAAAGSLADLAAAATAILADLAEGQADLAEGQEAAVEVLLHPEAAVLASNPITIRAWKLWTTSPTARFPRI